MKANKSKHIILAAMLVPAMLFSLYAQSAELLVVEQPGCVYCEKFNREIATAYPNTPEGQQAPLRRINLRDPWPEHLASVPPPSLTPTFILIEDDREVGRLHGYTGDEFFWFLLDELLEKLTANHSSNEKPLTSQ